MSGKRGHRPVWALSALLLASLVGLVALVVRDRGPSGDRPGKRVASRPEPRRSQPEGLPVPPFKLVPPPGLPAPMSATRAFEPVAGRPRGLESDRAQSLAEARAQAGKPSQAPAWFKLEVESLQKQQAVATLGGILRDQAEGRPVDLAELPADVRALYRSLPRNPPRALGPRPQPRRRLEMLAAPPRKPLGWLPAGQARGPDVSIRQFALTASEPAVPADQAPTLDAPSDHPAITTQAAALGNDAIRIYNFVHDQIATELYHGSKKGALGTLRERAGNDGDQASLLVALLRAAGVPARYEIGTVALSAAQAAEYAGAQNLTAAAALLSLSGIASNPVALGAGQGFGLEMEHVWVRAHVPVSAYRGVAEPGTSFGWVHLSPAIKQMQTRQAVDLRDAAPFDYDGYLGAPTAQKPSEVHEARLRAYIRANNIDCETLDSAMPGRTIVAADLALLPAELPVRRLSSAYTGQQLPAAARHLVKIQGFASQGQSQLSYEAAMASLWGKSVTLVYVPATAQDEALLASHGGLEFTPAYAVRFKASLRVDGVEVARGTAENAGLIQTLVVDNTSPASGLARVEHVLTVGSVYAFVLDAGLVPADLIGERHKRLAGLAGDDREAEKLHISGLTYFRELGTARQRVAGLHWHRLFKEVEEAMVAVELRVQGHQGTPLSVKRDFFMLDAALVRSGNLSVDGESHRRVQVAKLTGYESSFLEHRVGEVFYGPRQFSAVNLIQSARQRGVAVVNVRFIEDLEQVQWPREFEERIEDALVRGLEAKVPVTGQAEAGLGTLFGYLATHPETGAGEYIVAFETGTLNAQVNGGVGDEGPFPGEGGADGGGGSGPDCVTCEGNGPGPSLVHLGSGNYVHQETDLTLPARGISLVFTRTYSSFLGWHHSYGERIERVADGSLRYLDEMGVPRHFTAAGAGVWHPPPRFFQVIEADVGGGFRMTFKDGIVHRFDAAGRLVSQTDLNGHAVALSYDGAGRLAQVSGVGGATFTFEYQAGTGLLSRVMDSAGREVSFEHDAGGRIALERNVLGNQRRYTYDGAGRMRTKTDFRGNITLIDYDGAGRVVRFEDPEGGVRSYAYDERNRRVVMVDRNGQPFLWELNQLGQPVRTVDALGNENLMAYDVRGNKTQEQDARGNTTLYTHDANGNVMTVQAPLSALVSHTYGPHSRLETTTDAAGTTTNTYTAQGNLETVIDPLSNVTRYEYTDGLPVQIISPGPPEAVTVMSYGANGNVESIADPEGGVTLMRYTAAGHLRELEDANHRIRTMEVDHKGQVLVMRDAQSRPVARYEYDEDGNRTKVTDFDGGEIRTSYDKLGRLISTTDVQQNVTREEHDAEGRLTARVDARGYRTEMRYDALGRLLAVKDPEGNETRMGYCADLAQRPCVTVDAYGSSAEVTEDALGRVVGNRDPLGNTTATVYDNLGRRSEVRDPAGNSTRFGYDGLARLTGVTDAFEKLTQYGYDARGNRRTVTDANQKAMQFTHDRANRLRFELTPIGTTTEYRYDAVGNPTQKIDGKGQLTTFVYDANRQLTDIQYQGGGIAHFEYDVDGNRTLERNADLERRMTYDSLSRLATVTDVQTGRTISYTYDASGNRTSMTVMPDAETTRYVWDGRNLLARLTDPEGGVYRFSYDKLARRVRTSFPNGMTLDTAYDEASRVTAMVYKNPAGAVIESFRYPYDSRGNRTAKIFADGSAEVYGYDKLSRLVSAAYPGGREVRYVYDAVGNRKEMIEGLAGGSGGQAECSGDKDCDGVTDRLDNCPLVANGSQQDADTDPLAVSGVMGGWRFEEGTGNEARDITGQSTGLAIGVERVAGRFGSALRFDGSDQVMMPQTAALNVSGPELTLTAWIKPRPNSFGMIINKANHYSLFYETGTIKYADSSSWCHACNGSFSGVVADQWNHVAAVRTGTRLKVYINGAQVGDVPLVGTLTPQSNSLFLGCWSERNFFAGPGCQGFTFPGDIDEVGVLNRALTPAQIAVLAANPLRANDDQGDACDACPQSSDRQCAPTTCRDGDGDGYGVQGASACPGGVASLDCNDQDPTLRPGGVDSCDGRDNDCDGRVDEACLASPQTTTYSYNDFNQLLSVSGPGGTTSFEYDGNGNQMRKLATPPPPPDTLMTGLVGAWRFEEASGTVAQDSAGSFHGTLLGGAARTTGRFGQGLSLPSTGAMVQLPGAALNGRGDLTFAAFVKTTDTVGGILSGAGTSSDNEFTLFVPAADALVPFNRASFQAAAPGLTDGTWRHVTWVRRATGQNEIYLDGALRGTATLTTGNLLIATNGLYLGQEQDSIGGGFDPNQALVGAMDEVALWSRALTPAEIQTLPNRSIAPAVLPPGSSTETVYTWDRRDRLTQVIQDGVTVARYGYDTQNLRVYMNDVQGERRILLDGVEESGEYEAGAGARIARYNHDPSRIDLLLGQVGGLKVYSVADLIGSVYTLVDDTGLPVERRQYDVYGRPTVVVGGGSTSWGFSGRKLDSQSGIIYARERYFDILTGVWLASDPLGVTPDPHGGNKGVFLNHLYSYSAAPTMTRDPMGLFNFYIHGDLTYETLSSSSGFAGWAAKVAARSSETIDVETAYNDNLQFIHAMESRTDNKNKKSAESRWKQYKRSMLLQAAKRLCDGGDAGTDAALAALGRGLHAVQDHVAHPGFPNLDEHCRNGMGCGALHSLAGRGGSDQFPTANARTSAINDGISYVNEFRELMRTQNGGKNASRINEVLR